MNIPARTLALATAFVATVYAANWAITTFDVIPVGFGLKAPAGVLFAGLAFGIRDQLHEAAGRRWPRWVFGSVAVGAGMSYLLGADAGIPGGVVTIAAASAAAFAVSETLDALVYNPLRRKHWNVAVLASGTVGAVVDSAVFLGLAFGSLDYLQGQVFAKLCVVALAWGVMRRFRR